MVPENRTVVGLASTGLIWLASATFASFGLGIFILGLSEPARLVPPLLAAVPQEREPAIAPVERLTGAWPPIFGVAVPAVSIPVDTRIITDDLIRQPVLSDLSLQGIFLDGSEGVAFISLDGHAQLVRRGSALSNGATVMRIERTLVTIQSGDLFTYLRFQEEIGEERSAPLANETLIEFRPELPRIIQVSSDEVSESGFHSPGPDRFGSDQ